MSPEVGAIPSELERRAQAQPPGRRPVEGQVQRRAEAALDNWQQVARRQNALRYVEYAMTIPPAFAVVLGDPQHQHAELEVVYENAPQSLRDIEETCGFQT